MSLFAFLGIIVFELFFLIPISISLSSSLILYFSGHWFSLGHLNLDFGFGKI